MRVVIDPGHSNVGDRGAAGNGLIEADVIFNDSESMLGMAQRVGHLLRKMGHETVMTRYTEQPLSWIKSIDLYRRVQAAKKVRGDVFISLHCNGHSDPDARGFEVFAATDDATSRRLATEVYHSVMQAIGKRMPSRGVKWDNQGGHKSIYVLQKLNGTMPAVLIECGFLSNTEDAKLLKDKYFRQDVALAIARAVDSWVPCQ